MALLPQTPFGLRLPGTDGFSIPPGPLGPGMDAPLPPEIGQTTEPFGFQPPPTLQPPPVEKAATPAGAPQPQPAQPPVGDSDKKGGLSTWLPLILGTLGAGAWAAKDKSFTDFGVNLLQGAVDQTFAQQEEKRKRQFELETADLKQGQEVIRDLMAIDDGSLVSLENEIRSDPAFAHLAAYIGPLKEAKKKYADVTSASSDGGMKITAKEAASLSHYYSAVKGAKEFLNKRNESQMATGFAGQKAGAEEAARRKAIEEAYLAAGGKDPSKLYRIYGPNARGLTDKQVRDDTQLAFWYADQLGTPEKADEIQSNPLLMKKADLLWRTTLAGGVAKAGAEARQPIQIENKLTPPPVVGADGKLYVPGKDTVVPQSFRPGELDKAGANSELLDGISTIRQLAASDAVKRELGNVFGRNWANLSWQKLQGDAAKLSPATQQFLVEVGLLTSDKIKEKYGTAFSSGEQAQAATWIPKTTDSLAKILASMTAFERHAYTSLERVRDSNPSWPNHTALKKLQERDDSLKQLYDAFVAKAKEAGKTPPPFGAWKRSLGK